MLVDCNLCKLLKMNSTSRSSSYSGHGVIRDHDSKRSTRERSDEACKGMSQGDMSVRDRAERVK